MPRILPLLLLAVGMYADGPGVIHARRATADVAPSADPGSRFWKGVPGVFAENGPRGEAVPGHRMEVRARWTDQHLYLLYTLPYEQLFLKPEPFSATEETNKLWEWDVAEVFVGSDFQNIRRYKEFQVSPRGEWVDLDIDRDKPQFAAEGWKWNSGFQVKARIDEVKKVWYGEMKIPFASIDTRAPKAGNELRINFYRIQGPAPRKFVAWQPTGSPSYHVPEAFGRMRLEK